MSVRPHPLARTLAAVLLLLGLRSVAMAATARDSTARDTSAVAARDTTHRSVVPADSLPSADARAVLRTIPEPLPPAERVAPPPPSSALASPTPTPPRSGEPAATDTLSAPPSFAPPDTSAADTSGVPIPALTAPLGEGPDGPRRNPAAVVDTAAAPPPAAPPPAAVAPPPAAATPAALDTCWRLQIGAFAERPVAEAHRSAAVSQLLVAMSIESDQGRWKIRSSDCLTHVAADALRRRALDSGFRDAFLVRMGPSGEAIPLGAPAAPAAPAKKIAAKHTSSRAISAKKKKTVRR